MKKTLATFLLLIAVNSSYTQTTTDDAKKQTSNATAALTTQKTIKDGWTKAGSFNLNLTEAGRNDAWGIVKGGEQQTVGIKALIDYDFDKKKGKGQWLNNIRARYGVAKTTSAGDNFNKTDDYVNYTSIYATALKPKWNFSMLFNVESQFDRFFLSPGYIKLGPGILYKPNENFSVMYSPVMANLTTKFATDQKDTLLFGVDAGKTTKLGLGSFVQIKVNYDVSKGINYKGFATLYSNYLNQPGSVILDWTNLFTLTVNKYIGATITINIRNNDFETSQLQMQHGIGVGFSYKL